MILYNEAVVKTPSIFIEEKEYLVEKSSLCLLKKDGHNSLFIWHYVALSSYFLINIEKIYIKIWWNAGKILSLHPQSEIDRAFSSAGLEHLPYKQRVGGSNPSTPTLEDSFIIQLDCEAFLF